MNSDDTLIKKIQKVIKDEIRPVKELTEILKKKVDSTEFLHTATRESVRTMKDQQSVINEKLDDIKTSIDNPKTGLVAINKRLGGVKNRLDDPKTGLTRISAKLDATFEQAIELTENTGKLNKRVNTLENNAGIIPPPELTIPRLD